MSTAVPCTPTVKPFQYSFVLLYQVNVSSAPVHRSTPRGSEPPTLLLLRWHSKSRPLVLYNQYVEIQTERNFCVNSSAWTQRA
jgi:hypothetical protein